MSFSIAGPPQIIARSWVGSICGKPMSLHSLRAGDQIGQPALVAERLARHRRVVDELVAHQLAEDGRACGSS